MADFCMQCSIATFGDDIGDLAGLSNNADDAVGNYPVVLCEGCGSIQVDSKGRCMSRDCLEKGHPGHPPHKPLTVPHAHKVVGELRYACFHVLFTVSEDEHYVVQHGNTLQGFDDCGEAREYFEEQVNDCLHRMSRSMVLDQVQSNRSAGEPR